MESDSPVDCQSRGLDRAKQLFLPQAKMQTNLRRVTLTDAKGSSDFFGNHNSPQIVHASDNTGCFYISFSFTHL